MLAVTQSVRQATEAGPSSEAPAPELVESGFALEIADAPLLHRGLNLADLAHLLVLREAGIVPAPASARVLGAVLAVHRDVPAQAFPYDAAVGDPYNSREAYFVERLGDDVGWLHAGRPRREAGRVAMRLHLRGVVTGLAGEAARFAVTAAQVARSQAATVMPDQTYLQQAQPSTFGHYLLAFAYPVLRDAGRLLEAADWVNRSPGGAGCVNGSRLGLDRRRTAELLGFDGFIVHTRDAMWQIDGLIDVLATAASLVSTLSKLAEDLEIWSSQEFDFVDLGGAYTRASVLMPQKRNPYALSIVRGAAGVLIGRLSGFLAVVKTPSARSDNLIFAYGEIPRAIELAAKVTRLMTGVVQTLRVHPDRMWEAVEAGFSQATDLAEFVMQACGVDYRTAYLVVGTAVRAAARRGLAGVDLTAGMLEEAALERFGRTLGLGSRDLSELLDPRSIVATRSSPGGAAPAAVAEMVAAVLADAGRTRRAAEERRERYAAAEAALVAAAEAVVGP